MQDRDDDTTIGAGGWALVVLAATVSFAVLHFVLSYHLFPAAAFAAATWAGSLSGSKDDLVMGLS